jgi:hypothetical protein
VTVDELIEKLSALPPAQRSLPVGYFEEIWFEEIEHASINRDDDDRSVLVLTPDDGPPSPFRPPRIF